MGEGLKGVILISGKAGVGKTTTALLLQKLYKDVHLLSFAHFVKEVALNSFGWDGVKDEKGRRLLQVIGTEAGREYNKDLWVSKLIAKLKSPEFDNAWVVIDDWRFNNEFVKVEEVFGPKTYAVRIYAPNREILKGTEAYNHISETEIADNPDEFDFYIDNIGNFINLELQLEEFTSIGLEVK